MARILRAGKAAASGKQPREFAAYRAELIKPVTVVPDAEMPVTFEATFSEPPALARIVDASDGFTAKDAAAAAEILAGEVSRIQGVTLAACERAIESWREELDTYLAAYEVDDRAAILQGIRWAGSRLDPIPVSGSDDPERVAGRLRAALDELRSRAAARRLRHLREAQIREASGYRTLCGALPAGPLRSAAKSFSWPGRRIQAKPTRPSGSPRRPQRPKFSRPCVCWPSNITSG